MRTERQQHHRGRAKKPASVGPPTTDCAYKPNAAWRWEVTWLPAPVRGQFSFLNLILDLFSRKIVGWELHENESSVHSTALVQRSVLAELYRSAPDTARRQSIGSLILWIQIKTLIYC